ncbi:hypothetical protein [Catellatospora sp. TT07R-123]|uniref:hypothetical protein n=1 Tax=Catellatospora sp. TT07R-123 TaxID=2733863 RepID=UPI001BB40D48|nr:hypothetical protein [Catellatospora sp. TT07R-123]
MSDPAAPAPEPPAPQEPPPVRPVREVVSRGLIGPALGCWALGIVLLAVAEAAAHDGSPEGLLASVAAGSAYVALTVAMLFTAAVFFQLYRAYHRIRHLAAAIGLGLGFVPLGLIFCAL